MHYIFIIFFLFISASVRASPKNGQQTISVDLKNPKSLEIIKKNAARGVYINLYNDNAPAWDSLFKLIASGGREWLIVAIHLRPAGEHTSEELIIAVGEALASSPKDVLSIVVPYFGVEFVCSGVDIDDERFRTYSLANVELIQRITAVSKVSIHELEKVKTACIKELKKSQLYLKQFFEIE